jgi:hypothetical protein
MAFWHGFRVDSRFKGRNLDMRHRKTDAKSDAREAARLARRLRAKTTVTLEWIAERLHGHARTF